MVHTACPWLPLPRSVKRRMRWDRRYSGNTSQCTDGDASLGPSESVQVDQHHSAGGAGSAMWKRLQIDLSQFFFHTEKKRGGIILGGDLATMHMKNTHSEFQWLKRIFRAQFFLCCWHIIWLFFYLSDCSLWATEALFIMPFFLPFQYFITRQLLY